MAYLEHLTQLLSAFPLHICELKVSQVQVAIAGEGVNCLAVF